MILASIPSLRVFRTRHSSPPFVFLLCLLALPLVSPAAIRYVDNSGSPVCSNGPSNGSEASPWCTIAYGVSHIASGDTLYVKNGTYNEELTISGPDGSAGAPTTISAYPGHKPTLRGNGNNTGRIRLNSVSYMTLTGFNVTNYNQGIFVDSSDHVIISQNIVYNIGQEGIHPHLNSSFITIDSNVVHDTGTWTADGEGIYVGSGSGTQDNTNNVTVKNNTIYNATNEGIEIKPGTHDCLVEGNLIYNVNTSDNGYGGGALEIDESTVSGNAWSSNPKHVVRNNIVHNVGPGSGSVLINSAMRLATGVTAYNNIVYGINSIGVGIRSENPSGDSYTRYIYHNTIDVTSARAFVNSGGTVDVKNNIGPSMANNMTVNSAYFVDHAAHDYRLVAGSAPINAGLDLTATVATDILGVSRLVGGAPDRGAYEYSIGSVPTPPTNVRLTVQ